MAFSNQTEGDRAQSFHNHIWWIILTSATLCSIYLLVVASRPLGYFWLIDEGGKFIYLQSTLKTGNPAAPIIYPGQSFDPQVKFIPLFHRFLRGTNVYLFPSTSC
jgi:hypothetical protein